MANPKSLSDLLMNESPGKKIAQLPLANFDFNLNFNPALAQINFNDPAFADFNFQDPAFSEVDTGHVDFNFTEHSGQPSSPSCDTLPAAVSMGTTASTSLTPSVTTSLLIDLELQIALVNSNPSTHATTHAQRNPLLPTQCPCEHIKAAS
ncbi:hypothetical protein GYMLUDRAFT_238347 [Collybiopsis luxurians FD-317 M1]|nr:hypothetical protein GYMLUDRAFT_238347 [Collybiopsis luxurians FD-317 M1]